MSSRIHRFILASVVAFLLGPALAYGFNALFPLIVDHSGLSLATIGILNISVRILEVLPLSVVSAIWLHVEAKEEVTSRWLWAVFGLLFHVVAVAIFYAVFAYRRTRAYAPKSGEDRPSQTPRPTTL